MGDILNIQCKNCNYENTFCVGYGNRSVVTLSNLFDEFNHKEVSVLKRKLEPSELKQTVFIHSELMQCEDCMNIDCKTRFSFNCKTVTEDFMPFCNKCSNERYATPKNFLQIKCGVCGDKSLIPEVMGIWD